MEQEQEQIDKIRKMKKIEKIKRKKARKRIKYIFIAIIIIILAFAWVYFGDKALNVFDGKVVEIVERAKENVNIIINTIVNNLNKNTNTDTNANTITNTINTNTIDTYVKDEEEIAKDKATNVAIKKFKELGEITTASELEVLKIRRKDELYYYISSKENTVEVRIKDNKITRINSVPVTEETTTNKNYNEIYNNQE